MSEWATTLNILLGAIIGGVCSFFGTYALRSKDLRDQKRNLASAFLGEIRAQASIVETRRYLPEIRNHIDKLKQTGQPAFYGFMVTREPCVIFSENAKNIGMLDYPLPEMIAKYYAQVNSILEDMNAIASGRFSHFDVADCLRLYNSIEQLFVSTSTLGEQICAEIAKQYPQLRSSTQ